MNIIKDKENTRIVLPLFFVPIMIFGAFGIISTSSFVMFSDQCDQLFSDSKLSDCHKMVDDRLIPTSMLMIGLSVGFGITYSLLWYWTKQPKFSSVSKN